MKVVRLAAAGLVAGVVLGSGASAMADAGAPTLSPSVDFTTPANDGAVLTSTPSTLNGTVSRPGGLALSALVTVHWTDTLPGRPKTVHNDIAVTDEPATPTPTLPWHIDLGRAVANGHYTVTVEATTTDAAGSRDPSILVGRSFVLDELPAPPTGFSTSLQKADRTVTLTWAPNSEPDLMGYDIFRAGPNPKDAWQFMNGVPASVTKYLDQDVITRPTGTYRYEILAVRPSGTSATGLDYSLPSASSGQQITTPPQKPPPVTAVINTNGSTTGTVAPGSGSSGIDQSAAGRAGAVAPGVGPVLPASNDLSDYAALVQQANNTTATSEPPDTGYKDTLPYKPSTSQQAVPLPGATGSGGSESSGGNQKTIEYVAGALLLAVVAMFAFLLKRAADQAPALEAVGTDEDDAVVPVHGVRLIDDHVSDAEMAAVISLDDVDEEVAPAFAPAFEPRSVRLITDDVSDAELAEVMAFDVPAANEEDPDDEAAVDAWDDDEGAEPDDETLAPERGESEADPAFGALAAPPEHDPFDPDFDIFASEPEAAEFEAVAVAAEPEPVEPPVRVRRAEPLRARRRPPTAPATLYDAELDTDVADVASPVEPEAAPPASVGRRREAPLRARSRRPVGEVPAESPLADLLSPATPSAARAQRPVSPAEPPRAETPAAPSARRARRIRPVAPVPAESPLGDLLSPAPSARRTRPLRPAVGMPAASADRMPPAPPSPAPAPSAPAVFDYEAERLFDESAPAPERELVGAQPGRSAWRD